MLSFMILGDRTRHSLTVSLAALPTDFIVHAAKAYGTMAPNNRPVNIQGSRVSTSAPFARTQKAPKSAKLTRAAEPIAKPFPMAAVVFPAASRQSVRSCTCAGRPDISAIPPGLSEIGP